MILFAQITFAFRTVLLLFISRVHIHFDQMAPTINPRPFNNLANNMNLFVILVYGIESNFHFSYTPGITFRPFLDVPLLLLFYMALVHLQYTRFGLPVSGNYHNLHTRIE
jgi:hypothetical protein